MATSASTALKTSVSAMRVLLVKIVEHALMDQVSTTHVPVLMDSMETTAKMTLMFVTPHLVAIVEHALRDMA